MLRLNENGRFSSPVSSKPAGSFNEDKKQKAGREKRGKKQPEQLIVALAYGKAEKDKSSIADKVKQILAGTLRIPSQRSTKAKVSPKKSKKPAGPPKVTHPFFLGKAAHQPESETGNSKSTASDASHPVAIEPTRRETALQDQLISPLNQTGLLAASSQDSTHQSLQIHPGLTKLFHAIPETLTPFDKGECEIQSWTQKYAPKRAEDVLQSPKEICVLRNWLESLTVNVVETGSRDPAKPLVSVKAGLKKVPGGKLPKKKRKRAEELDDFIVSSEDESVMSELTNLEDTPTSQSDGAKRSMVNLQGAVSGGGSSSGKLKNAVLLSGPHGSGKTAAVYAVAKELGFEVFEINPGARRSGKDVLDKIGDMTENHLVQRRDREPQDQGEAQVDADEERLTNALQKDIESGKQASMNSFFKPLKKETHPKAKPKDSISTLSKSKEMKPQATLKSAQRGQKQSLILLEEVDILFEEDKGFWLTVFSLAVQSRRPIIMTCNDEDLVPLNALNLHAILRLSPAAPELAIDYLLLLAANEGHLLDRSAVTDLYSSKRQDLRASITDLDFWCQMAVGDRKGGLEWIFQRWPPGADIDATGQKLRVTSEQTYHSGLGFLGEDAVSDASHCAFDPDHEKLLEISEGWGLDITEYAPGATWKSKCEDLAPDSQLGNLKALQDLESFTEASSATDVFCRVGVQHRNQNTMDASQPEITEKSKGDYIEGMKLLQLDPLIDYTALDTHIYIRLHLAAQRLYGQTLPFYISHSDLGGRSRSTQPADMFQTALNQLNDRPQHRDLTRHDFAAAFDPISEAPTSAVSTSSNQMIASSFDRNFSLITVELAPYVRSIAAYDLHLEAERIRLGNLLSEGGKPGKRARTTRAARSALEGGKRATTRRERWFSNNLNLELVLRTGGKEWAGMGGRGFGDAEEEKELLMETGSTRSE
ncbi:P-loop containing nucleoside triphosphate hydrolase protein [Saccharata proteae CBS 121410]|uniref:P-loop containing nucleoside triphosphate hydrolase protein n=1 Tax=Saccharata proteae CBS 121410 TaxID=1314787 RepID=A0A9P4HXV4_9PEZI|nr:P-loop containing nucleoside triphosphate hydrolase protein [Saccharata proteae CBS 121410]